MEAVPSVSFCPRPSSHQEFSRDVESQTHMEVYFICMCLCVHQYLSIICSNNYTTHFSDTVFIRQTLVNRHVPFNAKNESIPSGPAHLFWT